MRFLNRILMKWWWIWRWIPKIDFKDESKYNAYC